jgi:hypothetical protein
MHGPKTWLNAQIAKYRQAMYTRIRKMVTANELKARIPLFHMFVRDIIGHGQWGGTVKVNSSIRQALRWGFSAAVMPAERG